MMCTVVARTAPHPHTGGAPCTQVAETAVSWVQAVGSGPSACFYLPGPSEGVGLKAAGVSHLAGGP